MRDTQVKKLECDDSVNAAEKLKSASNKGNQSLSRLKHYTWHYAKQNHYKDHYCDPVVKGTRTHDMIDAISKTQRKGPRGGVMAPFPIKLHALLSKVEEEDIEDIISWQPHGRCFVIHQPKRFVEEVMPRHFKQSKFTSFQRQVNLYGFRRLLKGADHGGYYHEYFLRGRPDLCSRIIRMKVKGNGIKTPPSPDTEPDFYSMMPCVKATLRKKNETPQSNNPSSQFEENSQIPKRRESASSTTKYPSSFEEKETAAKRKQASSFSLFGKGILSTSQVEGNTSKTQPTICNGHVEIRNYNASNPPMLSLQSMASSVAAPPKKKTSPLPAALSPPPRLISQGLADSRDKKKQTVAASLPSNVVAVKHDSSVAPSLSSSLSSLASTTSLSLKLPNPGEKIFFEGRSFRYMDSFSIKDLRHDE